MGGACSMHGKMKHEYNIFGQKHECSKPLGRPRRRWATILLFGSSRKIGRPKWTLNIDQQ
jgi:hypothetical protein